MTPEEQTIADRVAAAIRQWSLNTPRTQQSMIEHRLGISDLGFCRNYARLMTIETAFSDTVDYTKAFIGTAIGEYVERALADLSPNIITGMEVRLVLPESGAELPGHPDIVVKDYGVLDIKTVDGLTEVRRLGPSEQQQFQRHGYAKALIDRGFLPPTCIVGNIWIDRSGREEEPHVQLEPYDDMWVLRADQWLSDVLYAVKVGEEASKDRPVDFCRKCCEYFSVCRTEALADREEGGLIEDARLLDAIQAYNEGRELEKQGRRMKEDAQRRLAGVSGTDGEHMVRWIHVNASDIPGFSRAAYDKLDVRKLPKGRRE